MTDHNRSLRNFFTDPKTSVMTYIADNIPSDHLNHQQGDIHFQRPHHISSSQGEFGRPQDGMQQVGAIAHSSPPNTFSMLPAPVSQTQFNQPYVASNLQHPGEGSGIGSALNFSNSSLSPPLPPTGTSLPTVTGQLATLGFGYQTPGQQIPQMQPSPEVSQMTQDSLTENKRPLPLPSPMPRQKAPPQSAPRIYHRMVLNFEMSRNGFLAAKSRHDTQEIASTAYELESLSRKLWSLRSEHAREFEDYSGEGHLAIIFFWQAQYELWADTVFDIQDEGNKVQGQTVLYPGQTLNNVALGSNAQGQPQYSNLQAPNNFSNQSSFPSTGQQIPQSQKNEWSQDIAGQGFGLPSSIQQSAQPSQTSQQPMDTANRPQFPQQQVSAAPQGRSQIHNYPQGAPQATSGQAIPPGSWPNAQQRPSSSPQTRPINDQGQPMTVGLSPPNGNATQTGQLSSPHQQPSMSQQTRPGIGNTGQPMQLTSRASPSPQPGSQV